MTLFSVTVLYLLVQSVNHLHEYEFTLDGSLA